MVIQEIFPNPTVKQVIFQIKFPNLFYIEKLIGDFQMKIMSEFPQSSILYRKPLLFSNVGGKNKAIDIQKDLGKEDGEKIWQFKSDKNVQLSVLNNSLDITSQYHKTYDLDGADKFKDIIEFVLKNFFEIISVPIIERIGLRYIDECPIPSKDNSTFRSYYNSVFPLERFNLADVDEIDFKTIIKKGQYSLRYAESLQKIEDQHKLILDFDGFALNISAENCILVTDDLHKMISEEYVKTIREPVYEHMRLEKEE